MRPAITFARVVSLLGAFVSIAVVMGLIGAGLLLPAVGSVGTAAREGVGLFEELPGDLERQPLAQQSRIVAADGSLLSTPQQENRIIVGLEDVAPVMQQAQIAIEDERFYDHGGLDMRALSRALVSNATSDSVQGGSTLTQQYVKLLLLEEARSSGDAEQVAALQARDGTKGYVRKLRELKYAITLEQRLTKDEILEGYLNLAFYGDQTYGVEAAARHYFNVSASELTLPQAATLAGVVRAPGVSDPVNFPETALARRNVVLDKMFELGFITEEEWQQATAAEIVLDVQPSQGSCLNSPHPYFCDYVTEWLLQNPGLGATRAEREELLTTGGLTVTTTLDPALADRINEVTRDYVPQGNEYNLASSAVIIEPGTGHVIAMGQSSDYGVQASEDGFSQTSVNWNVEDRYGGSTGFQIGSVAKAFTIVTALEKGMPIEAELSVREPETVDQEGQWLDNPEEKITGVPLDEQHPAGVFFPEDFQEGCTLGVDYWAVRNAEDANHDKRISFRKATASSVNTAFAELASQVGTCDVRDTMTRMGLYSGDGDEYGAGQRAVPPTFVLGADEASPLTVAASYAGIAAEGMYCPPVPVVEIIDSQGEPVPFQAPECTQAIEPDIANATAELMGEVVSTGGSGFRAVLDDERPAGGKTGTSDRNTHTWFAGFTPQYSAAVWVGYPNGRDYDGSLTDITLGDREIEGQLYGSKLAAPMWKAIMDTAHEGKPVETWDEPSDILLNGRDKAVPNVVGLTQQEATRLLGEQGFAVEEREWRSSFEEGEVRSQTPRPGARQRAGSVVTIYVSTGESAGPGISGPGG